MKMNITFCVSSMPNHRIVSGISAATGIFRPKARPARRRVQHPPGAGQDAQRHADDDRQSEANQHAPQRRDDARQETRSFQETWKLRTTSTGDGKITGEISRVSGVGPRVASHQRARTSATVTTPSRPAMSGDGGRARRNCPRSLPRFLRAYYLPASSG